MQWTQWVKFCGLALWAVDWLDWLHLCWIEGFVIYIWVWLWVCISLFLSHCLCFGKQYRSVTTSSPSSMDGGSQYFSTSKCFVTSSNKQCFLSECHWQWVILKLSPSPLWDCWSLFYYTSSQVFYLSAKLHPFSSVNDILCPKTVINGVCCRENCCCLCSLRSSRVRWWEELKPRHKAVIDSHLKALSPVPQNALIR